MITIAGIDDFVEANKEHIEIAEALLKREVHEAEQRMRDHLDKGRLRAMKALTARRDYSREPKETRSTTKEGE